MKHINAAKNKLIALAKNNGIYENFGQKEVNQLKVKLDYNPYGDIAQRLTASLIDSFDNWCMNFDLSQL